MNKKKPQPRQQQSEEDKYKPYKCFSQTCNNMIVPTPERRPWFCEKCEASIKEAIRKDRLRQLESRKRPWKKLRKRRK